MRQLARRILAALVRVSPQPLRTALAWALALTTCAALVGCSGSDGPAIVDPMPVVADAGPDAPTTQVDAQANFADAAPDAGPDAAPDPLADDGGLTVTCSHGCDGQFAGSCMAQCVGTCDGVPTKVAVLCAGRCEGTCSGPGVGTCTGQCL
jgi:hypothetical protein